MNGFIRLNPNQAEDRSQLERLNITFIGNTNNFVYVKESTDKPAQNQIKIECLQTSLNNEIYIGHIKKFTSNIKINGSRNCIRFYDTGHIINSNIHVGGNENILEIGSDCSISQARILIDGFRNEITLGSNCMLSYGITIQNSDSHAIIDLKTKERINREKDIHVGSRVWIGANCTVLKGVQVGAGSIIGVGSVVTKDVPATSLVAGIPARLIRRNVSWTRSSNPSSAEINNLCEMVEQESSFLQPPY